MIDRLFAVIMAGGIGSRLWPRSRCTAPKQFLDLLSSQTMLQQTVDRIEPLIALARILVVAGRDYEPGVRDQLPGFPASNFLVEPEPRGTAPCIGLAAVALRQRDPEATMAVFPADHRIADAAGFRRAIAAASEIAQEGYLVTLGITPDHAHTGYGYIQRGSSLGAVEGLEVFQVRRFAEKPDSATAQEFVESGEYFWNAGIFVWRVDAILEEIKRLLPGLHEQLLAVARAWDRPGFDQALATAWQQVPRTTIDFGVMEQAEKVAVVPVDIGWNDVGDWATLSALLPADEAGNIVRGAGHSILLNSAGTYAYTSAGRLVAAIGLEDMIVVDTPDAVLICAKDQAQSVRQVVERLRSGGLEGYL